MVSRSPDQYQIWNSASLVLETGALPLAPTPADVQSKNGTLLGPATADAFAPLAPVGVLVLSDHPEFRWQPIPAGADWYRVQV